MSSVSLNVNRKKSNDCVPNMPYTSFSSIEGERHKIVNIFASDAMNQGDFGFVNAHYWISNSSR